MASTADLIACIRAAEPGPEVVACFDYDGTLISGYSASAFYENRLRRGELGPIELTRTMLLARRGINGPDDFAELLDLSLGAWVGRTEEELSELGEKLFRGGIASRLHPEVWQLVAAHRLMGHTVVIASSATRFQVEPMAAELEADGVLCTEVELDDEGRLTGQVTGTPLWGGAKASALRAFAAERGADLGNSFAYSNGAEDVPLLEAVAHPAAIAPEPDLRLAAERRGWPVLECRKRGGRPGPLDIARTAAMYGGTATGMGIGIGVGLLRRSRRAGLDLAFATGSDLGLALAGIDVEVVQGQEHLWSARPCVFVINHQSGLDVPVTMKLLREGFTAVAKKEARYVPVFGQLFQLAGVAFLDRGNPQQARAALEPAVRKLREEGISLAISPEGTRSYTPRLGPFKKGAFHIAMQAEVPMVPIVLRNAGELMWRNAQVLHPGTVEVVVLPPIDTSEWTVETLDEHVADVRGQFLVTLADWPGDRESQRSERVR